MLLCAIATVCGCLVVSATALASTATRLTDTNPGTPGSDPTEFEAVGNSLYFGATQTEFGAELWRSNGTPTGTRMVEDIFEGENSGVGAGSFPSELTDVNGTRFLGQRRGPRQGAVAQRRDPRRHPSR